MTKGQGRRSRVIAVVPVFCPPAAALANLRRLRDQVDLVIVNDHSLPTPELADLRTLERIVWVDLDHNSGIAAALNRGIDVAIELGAEMLLTVDQDSTVPPDFVCRLLAALQRQPAGPAIVGPGRVGGQSYRGTALPDGMLAVTELLQSGMLFAASTFREVGRFDEGLFIDSVDTDFCLRARRAGVPVLADPSISLAHQLGRGDRSVQFRVGPWRPVATGHPPVRRYYMTRNRLELLRRYGRRERQWASLTVRRTLVGHLLALVLEADRGDHARMIRAGVRDFLKGRSGPLPSR